MTEQERVADLCERLEETSEWTNQRPYFHAHDKSLEASTALKRLAARCDALEGIAAGWRRRFGEMQDEAGKALALAEQTEKALREIQAGYESDPA